MQLGSVDIDLVL